ncbi:radical SAM protein [Streptomyces sp. NPDC088253]|uniref:radical SAM protein n=1 Tax=Streptomyces sp. NPDC088253 TaxID=3365846 RepID=UPI003827F088
MSSPPLQFTLKVAARCNLACTYCYVYTKGDETWRDRPHLMSEEVFTATIARIREHCEIVGQRSIDVVFHGGEPCLMGSERFSRWCDRLRTELSSVGHVNITMQTNGVLIDRAWAETFRRHEVTVGVSLDGPAAINDRLRVDHRGLGSHARVLAGIGELRAASVPVHLLCVVNPEQDPIDVHEHLVSLSPHSISYLMPDQTHFSIAATRRQYGPTPCYDFLTRVLDHWWKHDPVTLTVQPFKLMAKVVLGGRAAVDYIGNNPYNYVFVEPDGSIEGLDVLRVCQPGLAQTGLNVRTSRFLDVANHSDLHRKMLFEGMPLPTGCRACPEAATCAGGYVPHRWGPGGFDYPSAWCPDLLALFRRVRELLGVPAAETALRRRALDELAEEVRKQS